MKKLISLILTLTTILTIVPTITLPVKAHTYNGFVYEINNGEVTIIDYTGSNSNPITIPEKIAGYPVTTIGEYAFSTLYADTVRSITIPSSVTTVENNAFTGCTYLENITVSEENKNYSSLDGILYNKSKTVLVQYPKGKAATTFTIPNSVTSIGNYAFRSCSSLTSVTIPNSVTSIGEYAFYYCSKLASVTIPNSVTSIGNYAFRSCSSLTNITVSNENKNYSSLDGVLYNKNKTELIQYPQNKADTSFTIPNSVTTIGEDAFYYCSKLTSVTIPNSVTTIGNSAFGSCSSLTNITVSGGNENYSSLYGILYDKNKTELIRYPQNKADTSFTIPNSVTTIGENAFASCSKLTSITIPNSVTTIGDGTFCYCSSLTNVTISNRVTTIGNSAFQSCSSLTTVNYPDNRTEFSKIEIGANNTCFTDATINYIVQVCLNGEEISIEYDSFGNPIFPKNFTNSKNKHFLIFGWEDKNGNKVDTSTLTSDNMIPLTAITAEIPVEPALLEADLIPNKDPYLPTGNKYINGFYVQGTQIRVPSFDGSVKMGLRFVNILDNNLLTGLKDGATDISYGTLVMLKKDHDGGEVTINTKSATKVEGKKTFKHASEFNDQYLKFTVCVTGIKEENFTENIIVRPYITFTYNGNVITLYGEQYENASLYSAAKLAVAEDSTENPSVQTWLQANIIDIVEQTGDNEFEL